MSSYDEYINEMRIKNKKNREEDKEDVKKKLLQKVTSFMKKKKKPYIPKWIKRDHNKSEIKSEN